MKDGSPVGAHEEELASSSFLLRYLTVNPQAYAAMSPPASLASILTEWEPGERAGV